jgi:tRNA (uracil-5-)-methyltransferase
MACSSSIIELPGPFVVHLTPQLAFRIVHVAKVHCSMSTRDMFRIKLGNVPKHLRPPVIRQFVQDKLAALDPPSSTPTSMDIVVTCRKGRHWPYCFVNVSVPTGSMTMADVLRRLHGSTFKQHILRAEEERYEPIPRAPDMSRPRSLLDQVTPLWQLPYPDQLMFKQENMRSIIEGCMDIAKEPIEWDEPMASPTIDGYRNKCEFSFGRGHEDGQPTLGFLLGSFREGLLTIGNVAECRHVAPAFKHLVEAVHSLIRAPDQPALFDRKARTGLYRLLLVRQVNDTDLMGGLQIASPALSGLTPEQHELAILQFADLMRGFACDGLSVKSFQVQTSDGVHHGLDAKSPWRILYGPEHLVAHLGGGRLQFRVSLESFFQVNPSATPLLYDKIKAYALDGSSPAASLLLDVCCGTGTIGLWLADRVERVLGVELVPQAVEDARHNAVLNGIANADFQVGRAEDPAFWQTVSSSQDCRAGKEVVAVLDPPRAGVHNRVLKALGMMANLKRIVLVSCDLKAIAGRAEKGKNNGNLQQLQELGWTLKRAGLVDMFPHTGHYETVMLFERTTSSI